MLGRDRGGAACINVECTDAIASKLAPTVDWGAVAVVKFQLHKLSRAKKPDPSVSPLRALILQQLALAFRTRQYRGWVEKRSPTSGH